MSDSQDGGPRTPAEGENNLDELLQLPVKELASRLVAMPYRTALWLVQPLFDALPQPKGGQLVRELRARGFDLEE